MLKRITIVVNDDLKIKPALIENIKEFTGSKARVIKLNELTKSALKNQDLIITVGGDGTFVRTANLVEDSLIIGINPFPRRSEGALTSLDVNNIEKLKNVFSGKFNLIKRQRAAIKINGKMLKEKAINEVFIGAFFPFHTSLYKIRFDGKEENHKSSGIIISTGTGSSAWFRSAGGNVFDPEQKKLSFIVREPHFGKRIFIPKILKGDIKKGQKLIIESERNFGGILSINDAIYDFNKGDKAEIFLTEKPLKALEVA